MAGFLAAEGARILRVRRPFLGEEYREATFAFLMASCASLVEAAAREVGSRRGGAHGRPGHQPQAAAGLAWRRKAENNGIGAPRVGLWRSEAAQMAW